MSMDPAVKMAFDAARSRFGPDVWLSLGPRDQTSAMYAELRLIDAETVQTLTRAACQERLAS